MIITEVLRGERGGGFKSGSDSIMLATCMKFQSKEFPKYSIHFIETTFMYCHHFLTPYILLSYH